MNYGTKNGRYPDCYFGSSKLLIQFYIHRSGYLILSAQDRDKHVPTESDFRI